MVTEAVKPMAGDVAGNDNGAVTDSRSLVDSLVASGALDPLFERIDGGQIELTGDGGLLGELTRVALERGLQAEMTSHLGYAPGDRESKAGGGHANSRNGSYPKTLSTPVGEVTVLVPRDRDGSFTPRLVPKHSRRLGGLDEMIISLYAGGMTVRDIQHHLEKTIGTDLSPETISNITDAVSDAVLEWQERPLDEFYPVVYLDAVRVKVRDNGRVMPKAAHIAIGVDMDGFKHVLGIWVQDNEGASFWAHVCAEMANAGGVVIHDAFGHPAQPFEQVPEGLARALRVLPGHQLARPDVRVREIQHEMPHSRHDAPVAHVDLAEVRLAFARMPRQVQETGLPLRRGLAPEPRHGPGHRRQRHPGPVLVAQPLMDAGRGMPLLAPGLPVLGEHTLDHGQPLVDHRTTTSPHGRPGR